MTLSAFKLEASNPKIARVIETKVATWWMGLLMGLISVATTTIQSTKTTDTCQIMKFTRSRAAPRMMMAMMW